MFRGGFTKIAIGMKLPGPLGGSKSMAKPTRIDPITTRDALGASSTKGAFPNPISHFGNRPRSFLKAPSRVRRGA
jgi:hypothetical protein